MFGNRRGRGAIAGLTRTALVIGAGALGVTLAGCAGVAGSTTAPQAPASQAAVPWPSVGAGWVLDTYSTGTRDKPAPVTLYLVSPAGAKYRLFTWPAAATAAPYLEAWAGDKTRALFQLTAASGLPDGYGELNLVTGKMTRVAFPSADISPLGYTLPDGRQILGETVNGADIVIARYTRTGALAQTLVTEHEMSGASYSPDGTSLAVPAPGGLRLLSNAGGASSKLTVPGASAKGYCTPLRWWNATTILADCGGGFWLVPASGAAPSVLTPRHDPGQPWFDLYDVDAWRLPSGTFLQSVGFCGTIELNKEAANGTITRVNVPGMTGSTIVVTASGPRLLMEQHGCNGSGGQLAWYNPATGAEQWLFKSGAGPSAVAYNDPANGTIH